MVAGRRKTSAESKLERRREARERRQQAGRRARWRRRCLIGSGLVVGAGIIPALIVVLMVANSTDSGLVEPRIRLSDEGRGHVTIGSPLTYQNNPPASGVHFPTTAAYGVHRNTIDPGFWVHNLEHGAIVLLYRCDTDCEDVVPPIEIVYKELPVGAFGEIKFVATPYVGLVPKYMLTAWRWQEPLDEFEPDRVRVFYENYVDRGPEQAP